MKTMVVNLRRDPFDVYIGRPGRGHRGELGNPVKVGAPCPECGLTHWTKGDTIPCFRKIFYRRIASDVAYKTLVDQCRGKKLGCFCKDERGNGPCHGDVYVEYLEGPKL